MSSNQVNKLSYYCTEKENQFFDRKSAKIKPLDILRHLVAFANAEGGQLVIGIEDVEQLLDLIIKVHIRLMNIGIFLLQN